MSWLRTYFSMSLGVCSVALYSFYVYSFGYGPKFTVSWRAEPGLLNQVDMMWHPPAQSWLSDLTTVVNGTGTYGLHFSGSDLPDGAKYGEYNYCNMPHVRTKEYKKPNSSYELLYVEVVCNILSVDFPMICSLSTPFSNASLLLFPGLI